MYSMFRGRPYGRLQRQLDDARHTLITETAKAEEAQAKAALAQAQIARLEGWIEEMERPTEPIPPMPAHMHGYQPTRDPVDPSTPLVDPSAAVPIRRRKP